MRRSAHHSAPSGNASSTTPATPTRAGRGATGVVTLVEGADIAVLAQRLIEEASLPLEGRPGFATTKDAVAVRRKPLNRSFPRTRESRFFKLNADDVKAGFPRA